MGATISLLATYTVLIVGGYSYFHPDKFLDAYHWLCNKFRQAGPVTPVEHVARQIVGNARAGGTGSGSNDQAKRAKKNKKVAKSAGHKQNEKKDDESAVVGSSSAVETSPATKTAEKRKERNEELDDAAFARRLSTAQQGYEIKKTGNNGPKVRTVKQKKANGKAEELSSSANSARSATPESTPASTNDGEDDMSDLASPTVDAFVASEDTSGVKDMLEAKNSGPGSLRITASEKPYIPQAPKVSKAKIEPLTKKQRQRQKQNEERNAERLEAEKVRLAALNKQLKTARTAEGTAKSGVPKTAPAPAKNAWSAGDGEKEKDVVSLGPNLDTYDEPTRSVHLTQKVTPAASNIGNVTSGINGVPSGVKESDLSSDSQAGEWETVNVAKLGEEDENGWQEAGSKKKSKKKKTPEAQAE